MDYFTNKDKVYDHSSMGGWDLGYCDQPHGDTMGWDAWDKFVDKTTSQISTAIDKGTDRLVTSAVSNVTNWGESKLAKLFGGGTPVKSVGGGTVNVVLDGSGRPKNTQVVATKKWYENPWIIGGSVVGFLGVVTLIAFAIRKK